MTNGVVASYSLTLNWSQSVPPEASRASAVPEVAGTVSLIVSGWALRSQHMVSHWKSLSPNLESFDVLLKGCFAVIIHVEFFLLDDSVCVPFVLAVSCDGSAVCCVSLGLRHRRVYWLNTAGWKNHCSLHIFKPYKTHNLRHLIKQDECYEHSVKDPISKRHWTLFLFMYKQLWIAK